jgi:chemotaxis methyl-accepting protein methylase
MIRVYSGDSKGATAFFRNRTLLETIARLLHDQRYRVLFHACSVGAEPYSFAIYCRLRGVD